MKGRPFFFLTIVLGLLLAGFGAYNVITSFFSDHVAVRQLEPWAMVGLGSLLSVVGALHWRRGG